MKLSPEENKLAKRIIESIPATHEVLDKEKTNSLIDFVKNSMLQYKSANKTAVALTYEFDEETNKHNYVLFIQRAINGKMQVFLCPTILTFGQL
jgi:hypothetical protein